MRILLVSKHGDGAWFVYLLKAEGYDVDWTLEDDVYHDTLAGLIPEPKPNLSSVEDYDLVVFDTTGSGAVADDVRRVTPVVGDSTLADALEHDRMFGIDVMEDVGIKVPKWEGFDDVEGAKQWLSEFGKRSVFKPCGEGDSAATTYVSKSAEDMVRYLDTVQKEAHGHPFILQEFVQGTEISTEGWFNGHDFVLMNHTLEEKKFMNDGVGPNTGCAGNVVWVPTRMTVAYEQGLKKMTEFLREANYVGPLDLNSIVTEGDLYGIEWTPRFGYEGTCNVTQLLGVPFGRFLHEIATGATPTVSIRHRFVASIRTSIPPYPLDIKKFKKGTGAGVPCKGLPEVETMYLSNMHLDESGAMETLALDGPIGAPMASGDSPRMALDAVLRVVERMEVPDLQYRTDLADVIEKRYNTLLVQGWLRSAGEINV